MANKATKVMIMGTAILTIGFAIYAGATATRVQALKDTGTDAAHVQALKENGSSDPLPDVLREAHAHPDAIKTEHGFYVKKKEKPDHKFSQDEIVNDVQHTNEKTKMIVVNGDIYIKEE